MPSPSSSRKGTNIIMRQGQTAHFVGDNNPQVDAKGEITSPPKDLKP